MIIPRNIILWLAVLLPLSAAASQVPEVAELLFVGVVLLVALAALDGWLAVRRSREISITMPELTRLSLEREGELTLAIANPDQRQFELKLMPLFCAELGSKEQIRTLTVEGHERLNFNWRCIPAKRGLYQVAACYFEEKSPLGFWSARGRREMDSAVRVYPDLRKERTRLAAVFLNKSALGIHLQRMIGQGKEFEKLREYVPGDSYDIISWKATAKRARPISKVFQVERTQEVYAIIDTSRLSDKTRDGQAVLESYLAAALTLGLVTDKQGDQFGVITFDDQVRSFIRAKSGKEHHHICRDAIYTSQPSLSSPDYSNLFSFIRTHLRRRALLLFLTDLDEAPLAEGFVAQIPMVSRQHLCQVFMVPDSNTNPIFETGHVSQSNEIYSRLAGHLNWADLAQAKRSLAKIGVNLSLIEPDALTISLIENYLDVKRRQML